MGLFLSLIGSVPAVDPPSGGISPLAWTIIVALSVTLTTVAGALWRDRSKVYDDLKACNAGRAESEEEILALLKVLRSQLDRSKGGKPQ
jgi:hypothetical protein